MLTSKILHLAAAGLSLLASLPVSVTSQSCIPNPDRPILAEETYLIVNLQEPNNETNQVLQSALEGSITSAYTDEATDCTLGSSRSLTNCTVILENIEFIAEALLVSCLYESNSIDGDIFLSDEDSSCTCECGDPPTPFPALLAADGTCPCACIGDLFECVCYPPTELNYLEIINEIYQATTDDQGRNVSVVGISDLEILDCGTSGFTYNATSVCIPTTPAPVAAVIPSESPTVDPNPPTLKPTRRPSKKPTKHPTKKPTDKPTKKPTKKPSKPPTNKPTHAPTVQPTICEEVCHTYYYSRLCHLLKENNLCDTLDSTDSEFTLFAPLNSAFHEFDDLDLSAYVELDIVKVLLNHVVEGVVETVDSLECEKKITMLSGETTETRCVNKKARRALQSSDFETVKFQYGKGNDKAETKPEIWPTFVKTKNGNILEVDEVIIPELRVPTESPTKAPTMKPTTPLPTNAPTKAPTRSPTKNPTKAPTRSPTKNPTKAPTRSPTIPPTPCTQDNPIFFYGQDLTKNCDYVGLKPEIRCDKKGAREGCCLTCKNFP